jgi:hypothetical protein
MAIDVYKEWLGIPDGSRPPDHYELLRVVRFEDDGEKIRAHYKKLNAHVRKYATGQYSIESQDLLNELAKAMLCLTDLERKRDYDASLGREVPPAVDQFGRQALLDVLVAGGHLSREQKRDVEEFANSRGLHARDAVVQMKLVDPKLAAQALARQLGFSYVDLEEVIPEDGALDVVSRSLVKKHTFVPLFVDDDRILIACADEPEHDLEDELRLRYGTSVRPVIATPRAINQAIAQYYAPGMRDEGKAVATPTKTRGGGSPTKPAKATRASSARFRDLSDAEKAQRKQYGILFLCWSVLIPMSPALLAVAVPQIRLAMSSLPLLGLIPWLTVLTLPATLWWVTQRYWK